MSDFRPVREGEIGPEAAASIGFKEFKPQILTCNGGEEDSSRASYDALRVRKMIYNVKVPQGIHSVIRGWKEKNGDVLGVVVTNLVAYLNKGKTQLIYSRDNSTKAKDRYNRKGITTYKLLKAIDVLEARGLIINTVAPSRQNPKLPRICSSITATQLFIDMFSNMLVREQAELSIIANQESVILRDEKKQDVDYKECDISRSSRIMLEHYNKGLRKFNITLDGKPQECSVVRIFNIDFLSTGRLFRSWLQSLSKEDRLRVEVDGESVIEVDFSNMHLRMLLDMYLLSHRITEMDAYLMPLSGAYRDNPVNRKVIKMGFNMMMNCSNPKQACDAIQGKLNFELKGSDFKSGKEVFDCITKGYDFLFEHPAISTTLWQSKPMAYMLQRKESDIALEVCMVMTDLNLFVAPIHDSFLCKHSDFVLLCSIIGDTYRKHLCVGGMVPVGVSSKDAKWCLNV